MKRWNLPAEITAGGGKHQEVKANGYTQPTSLTFHNIIITKDTKIHTPVQTNDREEEGDGSRRTAGKGRPQDTVPLEDKVPVACYVPTTKRMYYLHFQQSLDKPGLNDHQSFSRSAN